MSRTRKNVMRLVIAMMMVFVIAVGGVVTYTYACWKMAPAYESYTSFADGEGVVGEANFVDNELKAYMHRRNGDRPSRTVYVVMENQGVLENAILQDKQIDYYDDGTVDVHVL